MGDTTTSDRPNLLLANIPNLAIFMVIGWGVLVGQATLSSTRPDAPKSSGQQVASTIEARFWQDPFFWDAEKVDWKKSNPIVPPSTVSKPVLGLMVLLDGDKYADAIETRTRTRYAVVSALLQGGYQGLASGDLNITVLGNPVPFLAPSLADLGTSLPFIIPQKRLDKEHSHFQTIVTWERFQPFNSETTQYFRIDNGGLGDPLSAVPDPEFAEVRIYYVNESSLGQDFYPRLQILTRSLREDLMQNFRTNGDKVRMAVLGPTDSPKLVNLIAGAIQFPQVTGKLSDCPPCPIYAPVPTLSQTVLRKLVIEAVPDQDEKQAVKCFAQTYASGNVSGIISPFTITLPDGQKIYRTNGTDDALLASLLQEMNNRGVDIKDPKTRFALVMEADTSYARTIPDRFVRQVRAYHLKHFERDWSEWFSAMRNTFWGMNTEEAWVPFVREYRKKLTTNLTPPLNHRVERELEAISGDPTLEDNLAFDREFDKFMEAHPKLEVHKAALWEWTLLGRALSASQAGQSEVACDFLTDIPGFCGALDSGWTGKSAPSPDEPALRKVEVFTYLRGVDGKLQGGATSGSDSTVTASKSGTQNKSDSYQPGQEPALGLGQYDYLRRMVTTLAEESNRSSQSGNGKFDVIGVTGSDVYDKLVILRALKHQFPSALLFTTDLNVVYLQASEIDYTRGLLVGSRYGLSLPFFPETFQYTSKISPFRDSYQTAMYDTCLKILGAADPTKIYPEDLMPPRAGVFEIARSGFYPLSVPESATEEAGTHQDKDWRTSLPWLGGFGFWVETALVATIVFIVLANLYFVADREAGLLTARFFIIGLVTITIMAGVISWVSGRPGEEPFAIFEGISTWPSTFIRTLVVLFSFLFVWNIHQQLRRHPGEIDDMVRTWSNTKATLTEGEPFANYLYSIPEINQPPRQILPTLPTKLGTNLSSIRSSNSGKLTFGDGFRSRRSG